MNESAVKPCEASCFGIITVYLKPMYVIDCIIGPSSSLCHFLTICHVTLQFFLLLTALDSWIRYGTYADRWKMGEMAMF